MQRGILLYLEEKILNCAIQGCGFPGVCNARMQKSCEPYTSRLSHISSIRNLREASLLAHFGSADPFGRRRHAGPSPCIKLRGEG
jgi:hypothetical protein